LIATPRAQAPHSPCHRCVTNFRRTLGQPLALARRSAQVVETQTLRLGWSWRWRWRWLRHPRRRQRILGLAGGHRVRGIAVKIEARRPLDQLGAISSIGRVGAQHPLERAAADSAVEAGHQLTIDAALERHPPRWIAREDQREALA